MKLPEPLFAIINPIMRIPHDAAYHDIGRQKDGSLIEADLEYAVRSAIVVEGNLLRLLSMTIKAALKW